VLTYIAPFLAHSHVSAAATSASLSLLGVAGMAGIWVAAA
jgi:predicted MFS family arabinose efflux permease